MGVVLSQSIFTGKGDPQRSGIWSNWDHSLLTYIMKSTAIFSIWTLVDPTLFLFWRLIISLEKYEDLIRTEPRIASQFHGTPGQCAILFPWKLALVPQMGGRSGEKVPIEKHKI